MYNLWFILALAEKPERHLAKIHTGLVYPRTSETPSKKLCLHIQHQFILACIQRPKPAFVNVIDRTVYPRVRGEAQRHGPNPAGMAGSSSRARRSLDLDRTGAEGARFILACAEKPNSDHHKAKADMVHPRVRGEAQFLRFKIEKGYSSSSCAQKSRFR